MVETLMAVLEQHHSSFRIVFGKNAEEAKMEVEATAMDLANRCELVEGGLGCLATAGMIAQSYKGAIKVQIRPYALADAYLDTCPYVLPEMSPEFFVDDLTVGGMQQLLGKEVADACLKEFIEAIMAAAKEGGKIAYTQAGTAAIYPKGDGSYELTIGLNPEFILSV